MRPLRLFAVFLIFCLAAVAWVVLGTTVVMRTQDTGARLGGEVGELVGGPQAQAVPDFTWESADGTRTLSGPLEVASTDITAAFRSEPRKKGLLWYATYGVDFKASYSVANTAGRPVTARMAFAFPNADQVYDGFAVAVDGSPVPVTYREGAASAEFPIGAGATARIETGYRTQGMDEWRYQPRTDGVGVIKDFNLVATTNVADIDFADGSVSPTQKARDGDGWKLTWSYDSVVSGRPIALVMPKPANPGDLAYRITFFAPVSLLFFFAGLVLLTATRDVKLHPVHYGFLAAAFFAFHLLLSYLADQIDINLAFLIASVTSVALVVGYLRVVVGRTRALLEIALSQFAFLVLFSYSFFFEGLTGLAVTIGSVVTLGYYMAKTAKLDWEKVFERTPRPRPAPVGWPAQSPGVAPAGQVPVAPQPPAAPESPAAPEPPSS
ncbi:MAG TPA: inner membrane CreD family protein [Coriobacteriia bacterium]